MSDRSNLRGVFALQPRERHATEAAPSTKPATEAPTAKPVKTVASPADRPAKRERPAPRRTPATPSPTSFYVPARTVAEAWRARARATGLTLAEVLVAATESVSVAEISEAMQQPRWDMSGPGMPSLAQRQLETPVTLQVRLAAVQLQWLDEQVRATGAESRSHFVATLMQLYLSR